MGTTRIKVIDLSSDQGQIKTSRKHAEKLSGLGKLKEKPQKKTHNPKGDQPMAEKDQKPMIAQTADISGATESDVASPSEITETPTLRPTDTTESSEFSEPSQPSKPSKPSHHGKKYKSAASLVDTSKIYRADEAVELLYKTSTTSFVPTVELHLNVADKNLKGTVNLPFPMGKKKEKKYLVFADKIPDTKYKIPVIWANEKTIDEIDAGKLKPKRDFDVVMSSPKYMPALAKIAKILGPANLMPNPKNGTIVEDITKALNQDKDSILNYKTDPTAPIVHTNVGKLSQKPQELSQNLKAIVTSVGAGRIRKATLASTMGPGIKFDITTL